ncbi:Trehalose-6-P synthase/phosphatase complex synthase subunit [Ascosphaera pollenicola]|nr:Trehalose-6-P synthase/phosphatase complex synthase subunit [Ascosphaera pollenicola]
MKARRLRDDRVTDSSFKAGDWVLVRHEDPQKLEPKWFGPYRVLKAHPVGTYALQEPEGRVMTNLVNGARLIKAYVDDEEDVSTWSLSRWWAALKKRGLKVSLLIELRHVLDEVEKDIITYSEMSTISKKEQPPVDETQVAKANIAKERRKARRAKAIAKSPPTPQAVAEPPTRQQDAAVESPSRRETSTEPPDFS